MERNLLKVYKKGKCIHCQQRNRKDALWCMGCVKKALDQVRRTGGQKLNKWQLEEMCNNLLDWLEEDVGNAGK